VPRAPVGLADRAPGVVQVIALGDRGHHGHRPYPQVILTVRARLLVHWCDGLAEQGQVAGVWGQDRREDDQRQRSGQQKWLGEQRGQEGVKS
jgi:hypothetical protein